jgi:hypothetical protein
VGFLCSRRGDGAELDAFLMAGMKVLEFILLQEYIIQPMHLDLAALLSADRHVMLGACELVSKFHAKLGQWNFMSFGGD